MLDLKSFYSPTPILEPCMLKNLLSLYAWTLGCEGEEELLNDTLCWELLLLISILWYKLTLLPRG